MKAYISVVLALIVIPVGFISDIRASCPCHEEDVESIKTLAVAQCSQEHKISAEAFESIVNHEPVPDDHEVKCWLSCVMKKLGMIKEGRVNWENCKILMKQDLTSETDRAKVDKIAEICQAQVSDEEEDECELAYSAAVCKIKNWKKLGLPKGNMKQ